MSIMMQKTYCWWPESVLDCIVRSAYAVVPVPPFPPFLPSMLSTLEILLPVFALIFAGFACRRRNLLGPAAASELNRFVVWLALPALLFHTMAHATWQQLDQP